MRDRSREVAPSCQRYELKYWLPEAVATDARRFVQPFVHRDPLSPPAPNSAQRVTSLYLDTPGLDFYEQHLASAPDRFKLRVRFYGERPAAVVFFEVKRKVGMVIDKRRAKLPLEHASSLLERGSGIPSLEGPEARHLQRFVCLMTLHRASPKLLLTCQREAYVSRQPAQNLRVTFDRAMAFQAVATSTLVGDPRAWRAAPLPAGGSLLELKFTAVMPWWMRELAQRVGRHRVAYSKYVSAMGVARGDVESRIDDFRRSA